MKEIIYDIFKFLILGAATVAFLNYIDSVFLVDYLKLNLLTIQLAALAINISIFSLIITKFQDIKKNNPQFDTFFILSSLKEALKEQIYIIGAGLLVLSLYDSSFLKNMTDFCKIETALNVLLIAIFFNTIQIMWDTSNGIFLLVEAEDKLNN